MGGAVEGMRIPVPYLSQRANVTDPARRSSACSVTCLAMVLANGSPFDALSPDALYEEGLAIGGRNAAGDWTHEAIVRLSRNHGVLAYSQEFRSLPHGGSGDYESSFIERGIAKISTEVRSGHPVIASIVRRGGDTPHTVVVVGEEGESFLVHDPDADTARDGEYVILSIDEFRKIWRKFVIFFEP